MPEAQPTDDIPREIRHLDEQLLCRYKHDELKPSAYILECRHCGSKAGLCTDHANAVVKETAGMKVMCTVCRHTGLLHTIFELKRGGIA